MKQLPVYLLLLLLAGCGDTWEDRYKTEAKDRCDCLDPWQQTISNNMASYYEEALAEYRPNYSPSGRKVPPAQFEAIKLLKWRLTDEDAAWNKKLGENFRDKNSELYKCLHKQYAWSNEYPGNNTRYTVDKHAFDMGCHLAYYLMQLDNDEKLIEAVFD